MTDVAPARVEFLTSLNRRDLWVMQPHMSAHDDAVQRLETAFGRYL
jgi:hypothetical protein